MANVQNNSSVYIVQKKDCAWSVAQKNLEARGCKLSSTAIVNEMKRLAKLNDCEDVDSFNKKFFSSTGKEIKIDSSSDKTQDAKHTKSNLPDSLKHISNDTTRQKPVQPDSVLKRASYVNPADSTHTVNRKDTLSNVVNKDTLVSSKKTAGAKKPAANEKSWVATQAEYQRINNLPDDKSKVIEWHKLHPSDSNFVLVDKKACKAIVYSPKGEEITSFMVGLGRDKGDDYLIPHERAMTSAGIYTIDARGTGKDGYARLYNDNIFTMTTDSGATGVALHQIPNGNTARKGLNYDDNLENNRYSNGCVNFEQDDFKKLEQYIGKGSKVYILPEDPNNYLTVKNGKLNLTQQDYTGQVKVSSRSTSSTPIVRITHKTGMNDNAVNFSKSLMSQKAKLMRDLNIDNDTYNNIALLSLGIAQQESDFGDSSKYKLKENFQWGVNLLKSDNSYNSRGLTQMKIKGYTDPETKKLFEKYGITEDSVSDPKKCAIATMIVLSCMYKNELPGISSNMKNLNINPMDALMYVWNGRKYEITNGTATPDKNIYVKNVRSYASNFDLKQRG